MKEVVKYLQLLQDDMAVVVLLTILVGVYLISMMLIHEVSMFLEKYLESKIKRRKSMQEFYPLYKRHMFELKLCIEEVQAYSDSLSLKQCAGKYIVYRRDPDEYRKIFDYEKEWLDEFLASMEKLIQKLMEIHDFFLTCNVPRFRLGHPFLKRKISKMLAGVRYYADFWKVFYEDDQLASPEVMQYEVERFHEMWKAILDFKEMERHFSRLDRWFVKY